MSALVTVPDRMRCGHLLHWQGKTYHVEGPHADPEGEAVAVELWPVNHLGDRHATSYTVTAERHPDPARTCRDGMSCDCPDFVFRHAGTGSAGCKHIRGTIETGLIQPLPIVSL